MIEPKYLPEAVPWQEADLDTLLPAQEINGLESPRDWDAFGKRIARQVLAIYYTGNSREIDGIPQGSQDIRGYGSTAGATILERQMQRFMVAQPYEVEELGMVYVGGNGYLNFRGDSMYSSRHVDRKRPKNLADQPLIDDVKFIGTARLRSKVSDEISGAAGVSFRIGLKDQPRSPDLVSAARLCAAGPTFAPLASDLYPLLRRESEGTLGFYQSLAESHNKGKDGELSLPEYLHRRLGYLGPIAVQKLIDHPLASAQT
jgi:hypothetical protein